MASLRQRIVGRTRGLLQGHIKHLKLYMPYVSGKTGLEIGGPSQVFRSGQPVDIYRRIGQLDNCDFAQNTVWTDQQSTYNFAAGKPPGRNIYCDGSNLAPIADHTYDCVLSSHNLEHFANPVKALYEWKRVLRPGGALILVLPFYKNTFDHGRTPTSVDHMFADYEQDMGEDDLTHLPEIMECHDLSLDPGGLSREDFHARSLTNIENRCLHHHVFDEHNARELLTRAGYRVMCIDRAYPIHLCLLATL